MKKKTWIGVAMAAVMFAGAGAYAGYKATPSTPSISATSAVGIMGPARASADTNAYVGCSLVGSSSGGSSGFCTIVDSAGTSKTCSFSNPAMIQVVQAMTSNSAVRLFFDATTGACTQIYVDNYSFYLPITP